MRDSDFLLERQQPAGFCTLTNRGVPIPFPFYIFFGFAINGLPLPSSSSTEQKFNFQFSATCVLKKYAHGGCNLEGFEGAVLDISGLAVQETTLVIDRDPRQPPQLKCAGQPVLTFFEDVFRTAAGDGQSAADLRKRMGWEQNMAQRRAKKDTTKSTTADAGGSHKAATAMYNGDDHPHHDNGATATPRTYFQGPGKIYTGVVYAHDPHGKGLIGAGLFEYVRPSFVPAATPDADLGTDFGFAKLTAVPEGKKAYTPWEYNFELTRGSLQKDQGYPPYGRA